MKATSEAPIPPFQAFLEEHRALVYRFLAVMVGRNEADDCFQETFLAALRAYPKLRDGSNLRGWVLTIATRKAVDAARARGRRALPLGGPTDIEEAGPGRPDASSDAAKGDGLRRRVAALPPKQRAAVVHRFVLDRSYAEVAVALGCSQESARANVYQGLQRLRREMSHGDDE